MSKYQISYLLVQINSTVGLDYNDGELHNGGVERVERGREEEVGLYSNNGRSMAANDGLVKSFVNYNQTSTIEHNIPICHK